MLAYYSRSVTPIDEMYTCVILAAILAIGFATNAFGIQVLCNWFFHGWTGDLELPRVYPSQVGKCNTDSSNGQLLLA